MRQRGWWVVGTVVGIGALLFVTVPRTGSPAPQAVAMAPAQTTAVGSITSTPTPPVPSATAGRTSADSAVDPNALVPPPSGAVRASADPTPRPTPTPTPTLVPTVPPDWLDYTSTHHSYSLRYPPYWEVQPGPTDDADDVFVKNRNMLTVGRRTAPTSMSVVAWADATFPDRAVSTVTTDGHRHCEYRGAVSFMAIEGPPPSTFQPTEILGRPAAIRSLCSYVDAVIDLGDTYVVLTLRTSSKMLTGSDTVFAQILSELRLAEDD